MQYNRIVRLVRMGRSQYSKIVYLSDAEMQTLKDSVETGIAKNKMDAIRHSIQLLRDQLDGKLTEAAS